MCAKKIWFTLCVLLAHTSIRADVFPYLYPADDLFWNNKTYSMSTSIISTLTGFKQIFFNGQMGVEEWSRSGPGCNIDNRNYTIYWYISGDTLGILDVWISEEKDSLEKEYPNRSYRNVLEEFTKSKFIDCSIHIPNSDHFPKLYKKGILPAYWYSGKFYLRERKYYWGKYVWEESPYVEVVLKRGIVSSFKEFPGKKKK